jgi:glycosyltransferase involved in cell wall biosynthesis
MRICHIIESAGGGTGQVVVDLARAGVVEGQEVTVVYAPNRAEASFVEELCSLSRVRVIASSMRQRVGGHDLLHAWKLFRVLRKSGPFDVIHAHSSKAGALARIVGIGLPKTRKVYTPHCFATMDPKASAIYLHVERALSWLSDAIIVVSSFERDHAVRRIGISRSKIALIANGIPKDLCADRSDARLKLGYRDEEVVLGFVGRLLRQKNPLRLVEAFAIASRKHRHLNLAIVGEGPLRVAVREHAARCQVADRVRCFGRVGARNLIAGFDALVCSSDYEGFPVVFLEALVAGVPIIATPVGGARECVIPGNTGFIAAGLSSEKLAHAILEWATLDQESLERMAARCRRHAERFAADKIADTTRSLYERLAGSYRSNLLDGEVDDAAA